MNYWGSIGIATLVFAVAGFVFSFIPFMKDKGSVTRSSSQPQSTP